MKFLSFLPSLEGRIPSSYIADTGDGELARNIKPMLAEHEGQTGAIVLRDPYNALAARIRLARAAAHTLDVQYYIFYNDLAGTMLLKEIIAAADRGVRVRFLIDDNETIGLDYVLTQLDQHPNIEVRLFNPTMFRHWRILGFLFNFRRLNRRMHNKSFTADNLATVVGGRNIGDEYFSAREQGQYLDFDALCFGPLVSDVSYHFDLYWNSSSAYPLASVLRHKMPKKPKQRSLREKNATRSNAEVYAAVLADTDYVKLLHDHKLEADYGQADLVIDPPGKVLGEANEDDYLNRELIRSVGLPRTSLYMVEGYFVPTDRSARFLCNLARSGVEVKIYTNSFQTSDVWIVQAGYAPYRKMLLQNGVRLFEMRAGFGEKPKRTLTGSNKTGHRYNNRPSTLHAKSFSIDGDKLFVGSFNFDPRSIELNTEMGVVFHNDDMAQEFDQIFDDELCATCYEVKLTPQGKLIWVYHEEGVELTATSEPGSKLWQRLALRVISWLPIRWLL